MKSGLWMSALGTRLLIAVVIATTACGRQLVEFPLDDAEAAVDAGTDAPASIGPVVTSTTPVPGGMNVSLTSTVTATFSKPMNPGTLTTTTFVLRQGATTLTGAVMMDGAGTTATLTPTAALLPGLTYTATVTTGATDTGGLTLTADHVWMFTAAPGVMPLAVISTMPSPDATDISITVSPTATFNKAMNAATITMATFTLAQGATSIAGTVMLNGATNTAVFDPLIDLTPGLVYTATITTGAQDTGGLALAADHTWMFTASTSTLLPPMVVSTTPIPGAMNVALGLSLGAVFDQPMNPATINMSTFTLSQGATSIAGVVTLDLAGTAATFDPLFDLTPGLVYTARITTGAQAAPGMALATEHAWIFTAAPRPSVVSTTPTPSASNVAVTVSPTALFDRPMDPATITMATFTLAQGATPIAGTVMLDVAGTTAIFDPFVDLTPGLVYTATIGPGAQSATGVALASVYSWSFTTAVLDLPPTVTSTTPAPGTTNVALITNLTARFDQPMNPATITMATFTLSQGATSIAGVVTLDLAGTTATFDPLGALTPGLVYTARVTTGAQAATGMAVATQYTWIFTAAPPPRVVSTTPAPGAMTVASTISPAARFDRPMNAATITMATFSLAQGANPIPGVVMLDGAGTTAVFDPLFDLAPGLVYTATITTGAESTTGIGLASAYSWSFTTASLVLPPMVVSTTPAPGTTGIAVNVSPTALFDQPMSAATVNLATFTVTQGATSIAGAVTLDLAGTTATFDPLVDLAPGLVYTATLTTGVQATTGMGLATAHSWMFTTAAVVLPPPTVVSTTPDPGALNVAANISPTVLFDQPMNAATITTATVMLAQGATPIAGTVILDASGTTAIFNPLVDLAPGLVYTATVTPGAQGTTGVGLASAYSWSFTIAVVVLPPMVVSTTPPPGATDVAIDVSPSAVFDQPMSAATISMATFTVTQGATSLGGVVTLDLAGTTATFDPLFDLIPGLVYTATITTGAQSTTGMGLATAHSWMFTTAAVVLPPPTVVSTTPDSGAVNVAANVSATVRFDQPMSATTINMATFTLAQGATSITGAVTVDAAGTTATFDPLVDLTPGLVYTATITSGAQATTGQGLATAYTWTFTIAPVVLPPIVVSTTPLPGALGVAPDVSPTALFDQPMSTATITAATFTVTQGATSIGGVVTLDLAATTATFDPLFDLMPGLVYTATLTTGARSTTGVGLASAHTWTFTTAAAVLPPSVVSTTPGSDAMDVAFTLSPTAMFDQTMNAATLDMTTFTLAQGATQIAGTVTLDLAGTTATFDPLVDLTPGRVYTATITTGAEASTGMGLATEYTWTFTTASVVLPPTVLSTTPVANATDVALDVSPTALFDQPMNAATIGMATFTLAQGATSITGTVMLDLAGMTATFDPVVDLMPGLVYTATLTTGAQATTGMALVAASSWSFTTAPSPTVTMTTPAPGAINVPITVSPTATFSVPMDTATLDALTFTLRRGATPIAGDVTYNMTTNTATLDPLVDLGPGLYTASITTGARSANDIPLATTYTWQFRVGASCITAPVSLRSSGAFAVLAGSTVTSTGATIVTGDLGVWAGTAITGFPPGQLVGTAYPGVSNAMTAQADLALAYDDAAGRTTCLTNLSGDIGGMTLAPGVYKSTGTLEITTNNLVLDAQGDPDAVWIFSAASSLGVANSREVIIIGGGSAANVYWQVGSSATLGTDVSFAGTIMAYASITFGTRAVLVGRALAHVGAVTLDTTTVTRP